MEDGKNQKVNVLLVIISFIFPVIGIIIYIIMKNKEPRTAKGSLISAIVSFAIGIVIYGILSFIIIYSANVAMNAGANGMLKKAEEAKVNMDFDDAKEILTTNLYDSKAEFLANSNIKNGKSSEDISDYIMEALEKTKKEYKEKDITASLTASGDKIYLKVKSKSLTVTVSDNGNIHISEGEVDSENESTNKNKNTSKNENISDEPEETEETNSRNFFKAKDILQLNLNDGVVDYLSAKSGEEDLSDIEFPDYVIDAVEKTKDEYKKMEIDATLTISGNKIYLKCKGNSATVTFTDDGKYKLKDD